MGGLGCVYAVQMDCRCNFLLYYAIQTTDCFVMIYVHAHLMWCKFYVNVK